MNVKRAMMNLRMNMRTLTLYLGSKSPLGQRMMCVVVEVFMVMLKA